MVRIPTPMATQSKDFSASMSATFPQPSRQGLRSRARFVSQSGKLCLVRPEAGSNLISVHVSHHAERD
jgi:hypothetical protein